MKPKSGLEDGEVRKTARTGRKQGMKKKKGVILDPCKDAEERHAQKFRVMETIGALDDTETYYTTSDFQNLDRGYHRHCGPTALTNALFTIRGALHQRKAAEEALPARNLSAEKVFSRVARIGMHRLLYWNTDLFHRFGGTSNLLAPLYALACFRAFSQKKVRLGMNLPAWRPFLQHAFSRGALVYLELLFHPCYGSHHLLASAMLRLQGEDGKTTKYYLKLADGWGKSSRYLPVEELYLSQFFAIYC